MSFGAERRGFFVKEHSFTMLFQKRIGRNKSHYRQTLQFQFLLDGTDEYPDFFHFVVPPYSTIKILVIEIAEKMKKLLLGIAACQHIIF